MRVEIGFTYRAEIWLVSGVGSDVCFQLLSRKEGFGAIIALIRSHLQMFSFPVVDEGGERAEAIATIRTKVTLLTSVDHHVDLSLLVPGK